MTAKWKINGLVAGVDEAGRGPLMGPVVACAVILNDEKPIPGLKDSKLLSKKRRELLFDLIMANSLCVSVGTASRAEIDHINILQATMLAMRRAVQGLSIAPSLVLVDGNQDPKLAYPTETIIKGDSKFEAISAASIIAKVTRDRWCLEAHERYPQYGFNQHQGYGTAAHLAALKALGPCPEHRMSFRPVREAV